MKTIISFLSNLIMPFSIINMICLGVSGAWLLGLGESRSFFYGIGLSLISPTILSLSLLLGLIFAGPASHSFEKKKKFLAILFVFLSLLYTFSLISAWSLGVLKLFLSIANERSHIPLMLWSYGVAILPWEWLAYKDQKRQTGNEYSAITMLFTEFAFIAIIVAMIFFNFTFNGSISIFISVMFIGILFEMVLAFKQEQTVNPEW